MMIKQCITVLLLVLLPSLGLAQNKEANQPTETNQEQYLKLDYFKQVAGVALAYNSENVAGITATLRPDRCVLIY